MPEELREKIVLELDAGAVKRNSLAGLIEDLQRVETHIEKVNAALNGMKLGPASARPFRVLEEEIKRLQTKGVGLKAADLAKSLGYDPPDFDRFLTRQKKQLKDYQSVLQEFRSAPAAARAAYRYEKEGAFTRMKLGDLLRPSAGGAVAPGAVSASGAVTLAIPGAQVQASVVGPVTLAIPGGQVVGTGGGGGAGVPPRNPTTGQFTGGGGGGRKRGGGKAGLSIAATTGEVERVRTETADYLREAVKTVSAAGDIITTTHDSVEGIIRTVKRTSTGQSPLASFREARRIAEENFKQAKAMLDPNDPGFGMARLMDKQAAQLKALLTPQLKQGLGGPKSAEVERLLAESAKTLEARAQEARAGAQMRVQEQVNRNFAERVRSQRKAVADELRASKAELEAGLAEIKAGRGFKTVEQMYQDRAKRLQTVMGANPLIGMGRSRGLQATIRTMEAKALEARANMPPIVPPPQLQEQVPTRNRFSRGLASFTPAGFAANFLNVAGWATAVTALYKSMELATYSLHRFMAIGRETAQLGQVFRGVGGTVQQLADDVMRLASATGRDTEEAMASSKEWARLGLTRAQVNEAVRQSLMAANAAEMHTSETTEKLSALMHIYGLEVSDLGGVLGMLTNTSQKYNVTLRDLFEGLDRSAGVAKQAGMSLAELQGLLGATVGKTGQSGIVVGNTIKSILVQFNNPEIQKFLRGYGVETTRKGQQKSGSEVLRDLFVRYQALNETERQNLTMRVAGRLQAARFVAMMDGYVESQRLAIDAQLHLNSAQEANARIVQTLKAQVAGLRAEWDRLVMSQLNATRTGLGGKSLGEFLTGSARGAKVGLRGLNALAPMLMQVVGPYAKAVLPGLQGFGMAGDALQFLNKLDQISTPAFAKGAAGFATQISERQNAAGAYGMRARLFETISSALSSARNPGSMSAIVEAAAEEMNAQGGPSEAFRKAANSGNLAEARRMLSEAAGKARGMSMEETGGQVMATANRLAEAYGERSRIQGEIASLEQQANAVDRVRVKKEELRDIEKEIAQLRGLQVANVGAMEEEEGGTTADALARKQEYVTLLREQEEVMGVIARLSEQASGDSMTGRMAADAEAARLQVESLQRVKAQLDSRGNLEDVQAAQVIQQQIMEARARLESLQSPRMTALADIYDARRIAARRADLEASSFNVGRTEGERLLNEERSLQRELGRIRSRPGGLDGLSGNEAVRAKEFEIRLWQTQERIQERILELARQEKQIRIDAAREFQRSLLLAGPGEQLQRLYVSSLLQRRGGISAGEFNALSPDAKRIYYDALGGEAGALTREEMAVLGGRQLSTEQEQELGRGATNRIAGFTRLLGRQTEKRLEGLPPGTMLPALEVQAKTSAEQLAALATSAAALKLVFDALQPALMNLVKLNAPVSGPGSAPSFMLTPGFTLGGWRSAGGF